MQLHQKAGILHFYYGEYTGMCQEVECVALRLFAHNEKTYWAAIEMMERCGVMCSSEEELLPGELCLC